MFGMPAGSALGEVVHELTRPHLRTHDGRTGHEPALLDLLRVAIKSDVGGAAGGGGGQRATIPFDPVALQLWGNIAGDIAEWVDNDPEYRSMTLIGKLQKLTSHLAGVGTVEGQADLLKHCLEWHKAIRELLEPPTRISLRGVECPRCHCDHVETQAPNGERTYNSAIVIHASEKPVRAECRVCGEDWLNGELLDLKAAHDRGVAAKLKEGTKI